MVLRNIGLSRLVRYRVARQIMHTSRFKLVNGQPLLPANAIREGPAHRWILIWRESLLRLGQ
jgi:hypothetical protein